MRFNCRLFAIDSIKAIKSIDALEVKPITRLIATQEIFRTMYFSITTVLIAVSVDLSLTASVGMPGRIPILMFKSEIPEPDRALDLSQWNCQFEYDFCGLKNAYNMARFQRHSDTGSPIFGESSMIFVNVSTAANFLAARLESDYFAIASNPFACLSLRYLMYGSGAVKLFLVQQDIRNKCIWVDNNDPVDNRGQWQEAKLTIDLRDGNPRFFIEAHIDSRLQRYGTIAISRIGFSYGVCPHDDTNFCQRPQSRPIPPEPTPV